QRSRRRIADKPSLPFYAETLQMLARLGISREHHQTPVELLPKTLAMESNLGVDGLSDPLNALTERFYQIRYDDPTSANAGEHESALQELRSGIERARKAKRNRGRTAGQGNSPNDASA
ncbi:MAG: DUF4129 domain-containing protein, partial [Planctomycetota bacterium]